MKQSFSLAILTVAALMLSHNCYGALQSSPIQKKYNDISTTYMQCEYKEGILLSARCIFHNRHTRKITGYTIHYEGLSASVTFNTDENNNLVYHKFKTHYSQ